MNIDHQCIECGTRYSVFLDINEDETKKAPCPRCHALYDLVLEDGNAFVRATEPEPQPVQEPTAKPKPPKKRRPRSFKKKVETK